MPPRGRLVTPRGAAASRAVGHPTRRGPLEGGWSPLVTRTLEAVGRPGRRPAGVARGRLVAQTPASTGLCLWGGGRTAAGPPLPRDILSSAALASALRTAAPALGRACSETNPTLMLGVAQLGCIISAAFGRVAGGPWRGRARRGLPIVAGCGVASAFSRAEQRSAGQNSAAQRNAVQGSAARAWPQEAGSWSHGAGEPLNPA